MAEHGGINARNLIVSIMTGFAGQANVVSVPRVFFKWSKGDLAVAIFFSQAIYWHGATNHPDKWFARTLAEWEEETGLSRAQLERAAVILEQVGLERQVKRSMWHKSMPVVHYRFNQDRLIEAATAFFQEGVTLVLKATADAREKLKSDRAERKASRLHSKRKSGMYPENNSEVHAARNSYKESSREERKETTSATASSEAIARAADSDWTIADEANDVPMLPQSNAAKEARAKLAEKKLQTTEDTTAPIPQVPPRPLSPRKPMTPAVSPSPVLAKAAPAAKAEKGRTPKQEANDALLSAIRIAFFQGRGKPVPDTLPNSEIGLYMKRANELVQAGVSPSDFLAYVQYWHKAAQSWPSGLTLNALTNNGRISDYLAYQASQQRLTQSSVKQGYDMRNDPAYAYLYASETQGQEDTK